MESRCVSAIDYYRKLNDTRDSFSFDFTEYLPKKHVAADVDWSLLLVWNRLLNQLQQQCVFVSWVPDDLNRWFNLSIEPETFEFGGPRTITVVSCLTDYGVDELQRVILADDAIAYLEFVVYGRFPVANRNRYLQEFEIEYYPLLKCYNHFVSTLDNEYVVRLRREFETCSVSLVK